MERHQRKHPVIKNKHKNMAGAVVFAAIFMKEKYCHRIIFVQSVEHRQRSLKKSRQGKQECVGGITLLFFLSCFLYAIHGTIKENKRQIKRMKLLALLCRGGVTVERKGGLSCIKSANFLISHNSA